MAFSTGKYSISPTEIRNKVTDAELVSYYLGIIKIPCFINSPLRRDRRPSFGLYSKDGVKICWTDLATREGGGIYDLLSLMWHCNYEEVLRKIQQDMGKFGTRTNITQHNSACIVKDSASYSDNTDLQCKIRDWRQYDIEYWNSYGISIDWLKYADVYPISHKIIVSGDNRYVFGADKFAYAYVERKEGKITLKIYQPFNTLGYKWSNKHDKSVISLWTKIPERGDKVVICSSLKDALCLWANIGIPALAVQGEGYSISDTALSELKKRYDNVYILFDNDSAGLIDGEKLARQTGFTNIVLPKFEGGKDISDLYKCVGKEKFINVVSNLFTDTENEPEDYFSNDLPF